MSNFFDCRALESGFLEMVVKTLREAAARGSKVQSALWPFGVLRQRKALWRQRLGDLGLSAHWLCREGDRLFNTRHRLKLQSVAEVAGEGRTVMHHMS